MDKKISTNEQKKMSFIEVARRAQILECAIEVIATVGYAQASIAQIAKQANVSKGVITYYFPGKDEIMEQIVTDLYRLGADFKAPYIEAESTFAGKLKAYIESNIAFMRQYTKQVTAVADIVANARTADGKPRLDLIDESGIQQSLAQLLLQGAAAGEFRAFTEFSAGVTAAVIRSSIDSVSILLTRYPDLDLEAIARELVTLFDLASRRTE